MPFSSIPNHNNKISTVIYWLSVPGIVLGIAHDFCVAVTKTFWIIYSYFYIQMRKLKLREIKNFIEGHSLLIGRIHAVHFYMWHFDKSCFISFFALCINNLEWKFQEGQI